MGNLARKIWDFKWLWKIVFEVTVLSSDGSAFQALGSGCNDHEFTVGSVGSPSRYDKISAACWAQSVQALHGSVRHAGAEPYFTSNTSMSVCLRAYLCNHFNNFLCMSPVAIAHSSSGNIAVCYVCPVLWMTSHLSITGHMAYFNTGGVWCLWMPCYRTVHSCYPIISVKVLKGTQGTNPNHWPRLILSLLTNELLVEGALLLLCQLSDIKTLQAATWVKCKTWLTKWMKQ